MDDISLITVGNKGIGRETARRLHEPGHTVVIGARDPERGRAAADELGVAFVQLDVTDQASVDAAAEHVRTTFGRARRPGQQRGPDRHRQQQLGAPALVSAGAAT